LIFDPGESGLSYFRQIFAVKFAHFVMAEIKVRFNTWWALAEKCKRCFGLHNPDSIFFFLLINNSLLFPNLKFRDNWNWFMNFGKAIRTFCNLKNTILAQLFTKTTEQVFSQKRNGSSCLTLIPTSPIPKRMKFYLYPKLKYFDQVGWRSGRAFPPVSSSYPHNV
jgi:hypothetical protein